MDLFENEIGKLKVMIKELEEKSLNYGVRAEIPRVKMSISGHMTPEQAAIFLNYSSTSLGALKAKGLGPRCTKKGRHNRYHIDDVIKWGKKDENIKNISGNGFRKQKKITNCQHEWEVVLNGKNTPKGCKCKKCSQTSGMDK